MPSFAFSARAKTARLLARCGWFALAPVVGLSAPLDEAVRAYERGEFEAARGALEHITAREPANAAAHYYLGQTLRQFGRNDTLEAAVAALGRSVALAPKNAEYHADLGGALLQLAQKERSLLAARRGRDELEKALQLDPNDLDTRQALIEFYLQAPWPLGSAAKAAAQVREIARVDPVRGEALAARLETETKNYDRAFSHCEKVLRADPHHFSALCEFGRAAAASGRQLERGREYLDQALALPLPRPAIPSSADLWQLIGAIEEKRGRFAEAQQAYENAHRLDPTDEDAALALARVRKLH